MTGNIALDIAIGLVFVFVLYSLLASIIAEIIATFLGLRARNLKKGIERLLDEEKQGAIPYIFESVPFLHKLTDYVNDLITPFVALGGTRKKASAVSRFYKHPAIKYMAKDKFFSKPSYIPSSSFSKVVMDILKDGEGETALEKIQNNLETLKVNSEKIEALKNSLKQNPTDRASIKKEITVLEEASFLHGDTLNLVASFLEDAHNDLDKFQSKLEGWFNDTMNRASGWYKRKNQFILMAIGLFIAFKFNVSTIEITKRLAKDDGARTQMVALASSFVEENPDLVNRIDQMNVADSTDTTLQQDIQAMNARLDTLISVKKDLQKDIDRASQVLGLSVPDSLEATFVPKCMRRQVAKKRKPTQVFVNDSNFLVTFPSRYMAKHAGPYYEVDEDALPSCHVGPIYAHLNPLEYGIANLIGYLITALAISLGAPFWFDLLNKLVKLRSSTRPDSAPSTGSGGSSTSQKTNQTPPVG